MDAAVQGLHKRKGSAVDQLMDGFDGKAARAGLEEAPEQQEQQPRADEGQLTDRAQLHLHQLRAMQDEVLKQIDDVSAAGLAVLERLRAQFLQNMARVKAELTQVIDNTEEALRQRSARTLELNQRAAVAQGLVTRLNLKAQGDSDALFSTQQEVEQEGA